MIDLVLVFDEEETLVIDDFVDNELTTPAPIAPVADISDSQIALQAARDAIIREGRLVV